MSAANLPASLTSRLTDVAAHTTLLVACDYDGVLAPIVEDPTRAHPNPESIRLLASLADTDNTHAAAVSGRSLQDLAALSGLPADVQLVGSHGSEFDTGFEQALSENQVGLLDELITELRSLARETPGLLVETKPASVAFHYRRANPDEAAPVVQAVLEGPGTRAGVHVKLGKMVAELAVVDTNKGTALNTLRKRVGADAVVFFGDDVTDEDGFAVLGASDLGVKVGAGETLASERLADTDEVTEALARLLGLRRG